MINVKPSGEDTDPVLQMRGVGKEIWTEEGGDAFIERERRRWTHARSWVGSASADAILKRLRSLANPRNVEGMARFGISTCKALGIPTPVLQKIGREIGRDHALALDLWKSGVFEARCLAALIDDPKLVTREQMERWVRDFDNWAVCDNCCGRLFDKTSIGVCIVLIR